MRLLVFTAGCWVSLRLTGDYPGSLCLSLSAQPCGDEGGVLGMGSGVAQVRGSSRRAGVAEVCKAVSSLAPLVNRLRHHILPKSETSGMGPKCVL